MDTQDRLSLDRLLVVFKVAERCNINCSYCYYFNMGDSSALDSPARVSPKVTARVAGWLAEGIRELGIRQVAVCFHGGEPMILKPNAFHEICAAFRESLDSVVDLSFSIQTNGTILTEDWLRAFATHRVHVGVSVDGDRDANDRYRLDHRGKSTFDRTQANLKRLVEFAGSSSAEYLGPSTISVLDHRNDYGAIYGYLRGLGVRQMNFLLPDRSFDDAFTNPGESARAYGEAMYRIFEAWLTEDNPEVYVRFVANIIQYFQMRKKSCAAASADPISLPSAGKKWARQVLILHTDGNLTVSDSYIPALSWYKATPAVSIYKTSLREFLADKIFEDIERATVSLCAKCQACALRHICRGGDLENRFSKKNGFNNPSVYCDAYQWLLPRVCDSLVANGYPAEHVRRALDGQGLVSEVNDCDTLSSLTPKFDTASMA